MMALQTEQPMLFFHSLGGRRKCELSTTLIGARGLPLFQDYLQEQGDGDCSLTLIKLPRLVRWKNSWMYQKTMTSLLVHGKGREQHVKENHSTVTSWEECSTLPFRCWLFQVSRIHSVDSSCLVHKQ